VIELKRISYLITVLVLLLPLTVSAENVYRWVDDNGKVHFGRTLPPEFANRPYQILNSQGLVIERVDDPLALQQEENAAAAGADSDEPEPLFSEDEVRLRSDNLLLLRYHTEEDLLDAMENEVAQLNYDIRLIEQSRASAMEALHGQVRNAADRQRAGMPGDQELERNINTLRLRLRKSEQSLAAIRLREQQIRERFQRDIERYRFLQAGGAPGSPSNEVTASDAEDEPGAGD
jgi:hypothetical protein